MEVRTHPFRDIVDPSTSSQGDIPDEYTRVYIMETSACECETSACGCYIVLEPRK